MLTWRDLENGKVGDCLKVGGHVMARITLQENVLKGRGACDKRDHRARDC